MSGGSGYALAPKALAALAVAGFLIFVGMGFLAARPAQPASAPDNSAPAPKPVGGVEPPTLDDAAAVPVLAHKRPPAVRRRARWRREGESFDRAQRSARLAVRRAVALAAPDPAPAARPAPRPVAAPPVAAPPVAAPPVAAPPVAPPPAAPPAAAPPPPAAPPAGSETPAPFDDGGVPDSGEFDYEDGS